MKGQKAYFSAKAIHKQMYEKSHNLEEQKKLYALYLGLIRKAAYVGHTESLYDMGQQYENIGYLGIPNPMYNPIKSIYWYTKACEKNHAEACNSLATFYESGCGCEKNLDLSLKLYKRSADLGSPNGKKNYKIMVRDLIEGGKYNK
jgi:TPR repeat protein